MKPDHNAQTRRRRSLSGLVLTAAGLGIGMLLVEQTLFAWIRGGTWAVSSAELTLEAAATLVFVIAGFGLMAAGALHQNPEDDPWAGSRADGSWEHETFG